MNKFLSLGASLLCLSLKSLLLLMALVLSASLLEAQTPATAPVAPADSVAPAGADAASELPSAPNPTSDTATANPALVLSVTGSEPAPLPPQPQHIPTDSITQPWIHNSQDAFQPRDGFANSPTIGGAIRNGGAAGLSSGPAGLSTGEPLNSNRPGAPAILTGDPFPMGDGLTGYLPNGCNRFAASIATNLPSFNLMRGNFPRSPFGTVRVSYRDLFSHGANGLGGDFKNASASAIFTSAIMGNGMLFSIGATSRVLFAPSNIADGFGVKSMGTPGHSGAKAAIKLSF